MIYMKKYEDLINVISEKRVLFITSKNLDYIRNSQEIALLQEAAASVQVIGSKEKSYVKRLLFVYKNLHKIKSDDFDVAFVGFAPQLILPFFKGKLRKKPLIIDFFISVYDTMVLDRARLKKGSFVAKLCHRLDERTLELADYIVCDTVAHGNFFIDELGALPEKMHVLYLQADSSYYFPAKDIEEKDSNSSVHMSERSAKEKKPFTVLYFGSILPLQGVNVILEAIGHFVEEDGICFEIIGPIPKDMACPQASNIHYISWLSQEELGNHIRQADLCLAGHFSGTIEKAARTIPGKAYIYEACGCPMILGDGPANHEFFTEDARHHFVTMGDAHALEAGIRHFLKKNI